VRTAKKISARSGSGNYLLIMKAMSQTTPKNFGSGSPTSAGKQLISSKKVLSFWNSVLLRLIVPFSFHSRAVEELMRDGEDVNRNWPRRKQTSTERGKELWKRRENKERMLPQQKRQKKLV